LTTVQPEGYTGAKERFSGVRWEEIYDAMRTGKVFQGRVVGVEKDPDLDRKVLVVMHDGVKGYIAPDDIGPKPKKLVGMVGTTVVYRIKHIARKKGIVYLDRAGVLEEMAQKAWEHLEEAEKLLAPYQEKIKEIEKALAEAREKGADDEVSRLKKERNELYDHLRETGPRMTCSVRWVMEHGAYVDIGGIIALLPRLEVGHTYVEDVRDHIQPGTSFDVRVIWVDRENGIVRVSLRALLPDPWENIEARYQKKGIYYGVVKFIAPSGPRVELEPGVLVITPHPALPVSRVSPGDEVTVQVLEIRKRSMIGRITKNLSNPV